ncbi:hypothetical protein BASA83_009848 [Batrachochytrium salamandrivorans]|nr:hypothetical protein BASA83_009848 [Batrachochytrium salamandrivorans]
MQFFYLFSFVAVVSHAAALPQPAGLSEKYSNSADTNLASGLQARSYQPGLNSYKESATLVSLERRGDSEGSSGENSGSDSPPSSDTTPEKKFSPPFTEETVNSMALASTIDNVGDGIAGFYEDGDKAGQMLRGDAGDLLTKYLRRASYVNAAIRNWVNNFLPGIFVLIKSSLSDERYSTSLSNFINTYNQSKVEFREGLDGILGATSNIANDVGLVAENLQTINQSFESTFYNRIGVFWLLKLQLIKFKAGRTLDGHLATIIKSVEGFYDNQNKLHAEIIEKFETASSQ